MVKKMISRSQETKHIVSFGDYTFYDQKDATSFISNTFSAIPTIAVGNNIYSRIGDKIHITSAKLKITVAPYLSTSSAKAFACRLIVFSLKDIQQSTEGNALGSVEASNFFWGTSGSTGVDGYMSGDFNKPVNTHRIRVHADKKFIIGANISPGTNSANIAMPNSAYAHNFTIPLKHLKNLEYDENAVNPNYPTNHSCYFVLLTNYIDNTPGTGLSNTVRGTWCLDYAFKDA